ncbi:MAG: hypothetical protein HKM01_09855 [Gallionella sp.]|nr:hypothetical protein [Gallionella sp.]
MKISQKKIVPKTTSVSMTCIGARGSGCMELAPELRSKRAASVRMADYYRFYG